MAYNISSLPAGGTGKVVSALLSLFFYFSSEMRLGSSILFFTIICAGAFAQTAVDTLSTKNGNEIITDGYIEKFRRDIGIKFSLSNDVSGFILDTENQYLEIFPNTPNVAAASISFRSISVALVKFLPGITGDRSDDELKGDTDSWGVSTNLNVGKFLNHLSFRNTEGFFLNNTPDLVQGWQEGDPYIKFPDLVYSGFRGRSSFKWSNKFSYNAFRLQTERQLKSAGSWLPTLTYAYYVIDDRTPIEQPGRLTQKSRNIEFTLGVGYIHSFVYKNFYLTAGYGFGFGSHFTKLTTRSIDEEFISNNRSPLTYHDATLALGYNGRRIFAGLEGNFYDTYYLQTGSTVAVSTAFADYRFFLGFRFTAPKFIRNISL